MTMQALEQMQRLAATLEADSVGLQTELTAFPSGGTMLDVRAATGRMFVMAYGPSFGFGVDEVHAADGWQSDYSFTTDAFDRAATRLRELVRDGYRIPSSTIGLSLLVIYSHDIDTSKAFYERLGLQFTAERHGNGPEHYAATLNGTVFEIYPCTDGEDRGSIRLGFKVDSVDQIVGKLKDQGNRIIAEPKMSPWGRRAVIEDPDGFRVELTEPATPSPAP